MFHKRKYMPIPLLTAAVLTLAACGGDDGETGNGGANSGDVTVATQRPITDLDPHGDMGGDLGTQLAARAIYDRLIGHDGDDYTPSLATEWTVNDDATEWTFTLRDDVKFSDGTPLTANDVVASIERIQEAGGPLAGQVEGVTASAPDDTTVVFKAEAGEPALLGQLVNVYIVPADKADEDGFFNEPVGSGPFVVDNYTPEDTLSLSPNPDYWDGTPKIDHLDLQFIPETAARMTALRTGEAQLTWGVPDDQVSALESEDSLKLETVQSNATYTMWFNASRPAFKDAEVRRALWQAIDFEEIISSLFPETGKAADSVVAPMVFGYAQQEPVTYDPEAAKTALENAGFDFDATYQLQLRGEEFMQFAQAVASDLGEIGVKVEPANKEPAVWLDDLLKLNWDINLQSLSLPSLDAATNVGRLYPCEAKRTGYCNETLDQVLAEADSTSDQQQRADLYAQAIKIIWDDAVGMYPMFPQLVYAWQDGLSGVDLDASAVPGFADLTVNES